MEYTLRTGKSLASAPMPVRIAAHRGAPPAGARVGRPRCPIIEDMAEAAARLRPGQWAMLTLPEGSTRKAYSVRAALAARSRNGLFANGAKFGVQGHAVLAWVEP